MISRSLSKVTVRLRAVIRGFLAGLILSIGLLSLFKVLEYVRLLVGGVVSNILLNGFYLLDEVELILLGQIVQVQLDFFLRNRLLCILRLVLSPGLACR